MNVGNEFIIEGSSPDAAAAPAGPTGVPEGLCRRCNEYSKFCMKHLQKYIEKKPMKKNIRRIIVRTMVTGGEAYACGCWWLVASVVDIAGGKVVRAGGGGIRPTGVF